MGVALYRPGDSHIVRGVKCEMQVFHEDSYKHALDNGWSFNLDFAVEVEEVPETPEKQWQSKWENIPKKDKFAGMKESELRKLAKKQGIKNWHNKKIKNLKKELK